MSCYIRKKVSWPYSKTVIFLHHDERWSNSRVELLENYGESGTSCLFGLIIWIICPLMAGLQYVLLGLVLSDSPIQNFPINVFRTIKTMKEQLLIIYDVSVFTGRNRDMSWREMLKLVIGYTLYIVPVGVLFAVLSNGRFDRVICQKMNAPFLVDNSATPMPFLTQNGQTNYISLDEMNQLRCQYNMTRMRCDEDMVWGYKYFSIPQMKLDNIEDLLEQYNYVGFHDMCIYARSRRQQLSSSIKSFNDSKGLNVYAGYSISNTSGFDCNKQTGRVSTSFFWNDMFRVLQAGKWNFERG